MRHLLMKTPARNRGRQTLDSRANGPNYNRTRQKNRRGAAVVEFAVVAPVFFTLIFGMIEFGRVVMVQQVLTNATREGARLGVLSDATSSEVKDRVVDVVGDAMITIATSNVTVTYTTDPDDPDSETVDVSVSVPFSNVSWLPTPIFLNSYTLSSSSAMRREMTE